MMDNTSRYTYKVYGSASAIMRDAGTGELREATSQELIKLAAMYDPRLKASFVETDECLTT